MKEENERRDKGHRKKETRRRMRRDKGEGGKGVMSCAAEGKIAMEEVFFHQQEREKKREGWDRERREREKKVARD